jgi:hypothetical protein
MQLIRAGNNSISQVVFLVSVSYWRCNSSLNIIRVVNSCGMKWVGHIPSMTDKKNIYRVLEGKSEGKDHMGNLDIDESIILYWVLK